MNNKMASFELLKIAREIRIAGPQFWFAETENERGELCHRVINSKGEILDELIPWGEETKQFCENYDCKFQYIDRAPSSIRSKYWDNLHANPIKTVDINKFY